MDIRVTTSSVTVVPTGEIDIVTAPQILDALTDALTDTTARTVVFDLREVTFMDSSAAKCVIYALHRMRVRDGRVIVCNARRTVSRVLRILGLDGEVDIFELPEPSAPAPRVIVTEVPAARSSFAGP
jgi:anti-anti-sigma factor